MAQALSLSRRAAVEFLGTALLLATVVGSGIMGERLACGNTAVALLANSLATGAALVALILSFGGLSGAHFNPAVTLTEAARGRFRWSDAPVYLAVQFTGAIAGVYAAHLMFGIDRVAFSQHERSGMGQAFSEFLATFGLLAIIRGTSRSSPNAVAFAVAGYITAAYWFTASTSFANPAVTLARSLTDTFSGIRPADVPLFVAAQAAGATAFFIFFRWLLPEHAPQVSAGAAARTGRAEAAVAPEA
ncbi:MAG: aquaporin family protein [Planctomycetes bacterium]|nr:aquaporin family protein [Planctomycetota bacterium]